MHLSLRINKGCTILFHIAKTLFLVPWMFSINENITYIIISFLKFTEKFNITAYFLTKITTVKLGYEQYSFNLFWTV